MEKKDTRFKKGVSGNPAGKPKGALSEKTLLIKAIAKVEKKEKISLYEHFVKRALVSDMVLVALFKKLISDKAGLELPNEGDSITLIYEPANKNKNNRDIPEEQRK